MDIEIPYYVRAGKESSPCESGLAEFFQQLMMKVMVAVTVTVMVVMVMEVCRVETKELVIC